MASVHRLPYGQQLMLQRLMASHVMTETKAKALYEELKDDMEGTCSNVEECFSQINAQLSTAFGLEIATVRMAVGAHKKPKKYHTVINQNADDVSKDAFGFHYNKHELAFIKLVMQQLVESRGSQKKDLVNCRGELKEPYSLTLAGAEHCVETLLEDKWLVATDADTNRRRSMQGTIQIAPRSFVELSHMLVDIGYPREELPQFFFHRV
uniref:Non-structural maintenance of chromosomes element 1 homolog n=1 Tax=Craspedostauros australis TaxID=1486917 RepID=A0A7R9WYG5_9STRA|mmetsp:Transcript_24727/g.68845  ORF Transcript_24727/g.68845 Transcript_24727/m.68845 type:complete len:209 (+) Transcript_24727:182-808(+)|eukprot:CAMPEP_0198135462 /NCGR_PEP_ID=MMETSP1442-20131203/60606_1 /TAXON_ID= /ORGANISM="Craspedostauros australis, Strain CCMP3328" /LENGTH=208 /DNA_ID=CAMNT_0043796635 /DNA_START=73 /DNA_END=699 /DNA_ORIENTATION=+